MPSHWNDRPQFCPKAEVWGVSERSDGFNRRERLGRQDSIRAELNCVAIEIVSADSHQGKPHALLAEHCDGNFVTCGQISAATHRKVEEEEITGP